MSWLEKLMPSRIRIEGKSKRAVPEGLWSKCEACSAILYKPELEKNLNVCPKCGHHIRIAARYRLQLFLDEQTQEELDSHLSPCDPLKFKDVKKYKDRIRQAQKSTDEQDALVVMKGELKGLPIIASAFVFDYMGGSMGSVVGEKFVRAINHSIEDSRPLVCFTASGGARMQEALFSLFQMAKTSAALYRLAEHQLPFISVLTDPTMGGVTASLAMLGDIHIAEPKALIGFAGPRVIQQTVGETLPDDFQHSEQLLTHGAIDMVVSRLQMRDTIHSLLAMLHHKHTTDAQVSNP